MQKKTIKKATLKKLYVTERKSLATIGRMLSCSPRTVRNRCVEHGIKIKESKRGNNGERVLRTVFLDEKQIQRLNRLSAMTRVPQAVYIRDAIGIVLTKHEKRLRRKRKKREGR